MNTHDSIKLASELVKASLAAGWLSNESGKELGRHAGEAIAELAKALREADNQ